MSAAQAREVRAHADRIASSALFADSERLCRFLRFTIEARLSGEPQAVKEYVLGREVFDRGDEYDPRLDPIVRVEARRLRHKLQQYYEGPGRSEPMRIDYPKGSYVPVFRAADVAPAKSFALPWTRALGAAAICIAAAFILRGAVNRPPKMLAVLPAQWVWSDHAQTDPRAVPLAEALTNDVANRGIAPVIAWPIALRDSATGGSLHDVASKLGASRVLVVVVRQTEGSDLVTLFDIDPATGRKLRALQYLTPVRSYAEQQHLVNRMADDLAVDLSAAPH